MHRERTDPISTPNAATELRNDRRHQFLKETTDAIPQPKGEPPPSPPSEQSANPRSAAINISVGDALSTVPEATEQRVRRRERIRIGDRPPTPNRMSATNSQRINRVRRAQRGGPKSWSSRHRANHGFAEIAPPIHRARSHSTRSLQSPPTSPSTKTQPKGEPPPSPNLRHGLCRSGTAIRCALFGGECHHCPSSATPSDDRPSMDRFLFIGPDRRRESKRESAIPSALSFSGPTPSERRRPAPPTDGRCRRVCASKTQQCLSGLFL